MVVSAHCFLQSRAVLTALLTRLLVPSQDQFGPRHGGDYGGSIAARRRRALLVGEHRNRELPLLDASTISSDTSGTKDNRRASLKGKCLPAATFPLGCPAPKKRKLKQIQLFVCKLICFSLRFLGAGQPKGK